MVRYAIRYLNSCLSFSNKFYMFHIKDLLQLFYWIQWNKKKLCLTHRNLINTIDMLASKVMNHIGNEIPSHPIWTHIPVRHASVWHFLWITLLAFSVFDVTACACQTLSHNLWFRLHCMTSTSIDTYSVCTITRF